MTTPTRISTELLDGRIFTVDRALFVTQRGGCGVRMIHRIDRKKVTKAAWDAERRWAEAAMEAA